MTSATGLLESMQQMHIAIADCRRCRSSLVLGWCVAGDCDRAADAFRDLFGPPPYLPGIVQMLPRVACLLIANNQSARAAEFIDRAVGVGVADFSGGYVSLIQAHVSLQNLPEASRLYQQMLGAYTSAERKDTSTLNDQDVRQAARILGTALSATGDMTAAVAVFVAAREHNVAPTPLDWHVLTKSVLTDAGVGACKSLLSAMHAAGVQPSRNLLWDVAQLLQTHSSAEMDVVNFYHMLVSQRLAFSLSGSRCDVGHVG